MSVTLTFLGAAREVNGSCILVQKARNRVLVDCGMFQGGGESDRKNVRRMPVPPGNVFVAHGEESVSLEFAGTLKEKFGWLAQVPSPGQPLILG